MASVFFLRAARSGSHFASHRRLATFLTLFVVATLATDAAGQGALYAWGDNSAGQLGDGTTTSRLLPTAILSLPGGVTSIAAGDAHSLAVQNGRIYAWGSNVFGQFGNGSTSGGSPTPTQISIGGQFFNSVAAGDLNSMAVSVGGALYTWGYNAHGQVGNGTVVTPVLVPHAVFPSGVTVASSGATHTLIIRNGVLYACGSNSNGQLGSGSPLSSNVPIPVASFNAGYTSAAAGFSHSLAVRSGAAFSWGSNFYGQLGQGSNTDLITPTFILGLTSGVTRVAAGDNHSMAIMNGEVYAWGDNSQGQVGDGTTTQRTAPVLVTSGALPDDFVTISAGDYSSFAITASGRLFAWGRNAAGQLGLGDTTNRFLPTEVFAPGGYIWTGIAGGGAHTLAILVSVPEPGAPSLVGVALIGAVLHRRQVALRSASFTRIR